MMYTKKVGCRGPLLQLHQLYATMTREHREVRAVYNAAVAAAQKDKCAEFPEWLEVLDTLLEHHRAQLCGVLREVEQRLAGLRWPDLADVDAQYRPQHIEVDNDDLAALLGEVAEIFGDEKEETT